nr:hypothetical protein [uncultured Butyrivibrio sp.]
MPEYTCGSFGIKLNGCGGTWRAVRKNEEGFLLWESETYGSKAMKVLTDREGLVLYNKASSFKDFGVITQISKYKRVRDSICRELLVKEFGKQNGKTIKRKEDNSEKKENNTQNVQPQSEDRTSVNGSSDQKNTPKRPEKRKASGNNAHARESVMSKLREYQKYIEDKKPKAQ